MKSDVLHNYIYYICACIATKKKEKRHIMQNPTNSKRAVNYVYICLEVTHNVVGKLLVAP